MPSSRPRLAAALPGVAALVLASVALARSGDEPTRTVTTTAPAAATTSATPDLVSLSRRVDLAVGRIDARRPASAPPFSNGRRTATGTAWLLDGRGHLVTNAHVVDRATSAQVRFGSSSRKVRARIVGRDRGSDLAVLRVDPDLLGDAAPLPVADPRSVEVGEPVLAVGTPYRLQASFSAGIVSATGRAIPGLTGASTPDAVQTDAAINPGNSGGPLLDLQGRVVGVNAQGRGPGVSFAIGATTLRRVLPELVADGTARTALLGVQAGEPSPAGTRVQQVTPNGPAADGGIRAGDRVRSIGGVPTTTDGALPSAVSAQRPGASVPVVLRREGRDRTVTVRLGTQGRD